MSYRVIILPLAEADLTEAARWFDDQGAGLGEEFLADIELALERAACKSTIGSLPQAQTGCTTDFDEAFFLSHLFCVTSGCGDHFSRVAQCTTRSGMEAKYPARLNGTTRVGIVSRRPRRIADTSEFILRTRSACGVVIHLEVAT